MFINYEAKIFKIEGGVFRAGFFAHAMLQGSALCLGP